MVLINLTLPCVRSHCSRQFTAILAGCLVGLTGLTGLKGFLAYIAIMFGVSLFITYRISVCPAPIISKRAS